jgi:membrane protein implicated in regulation of membrane protease activity
VTLVTGLIGIAMLVVFLGFLAWWLKELPFAIIVVGVVALLVRDFVKSLRAGNGGA